MRAVGCSGGDGGGWFVRSSTKRGLVSGSAVAKFDQRKRIFHIRQGEVEDMIWEVDEDCDGAVSWAEFQAMYHRCRNDRTGANK